MRKGAGDHQFQTSPTISDFPIQTIDPTFSRTEPTLFEELLEDLDSLTQLPFFEERYIRRGKCHFVIHKP
jgi:hypothetical protein